MAHTNKAGNKPTNEKNANVPEAQPAQPVNVPEAQPAQPVKLAEPTSGKLEQLKKDKHAAMLEGANLMIAGNEKGAEDAHMKAWKIGEDIKKEIAAIKQHEAELLKKEKEAAVVAEFDAVVDAWDQTKAANDNPDLSLDEKNAVYNDYKAKREKIVNRLLGSRPATTGTKTTGTTTGTKGATGTAIHDLIISKIAEGKSLADAKKEIVNEGYSRGTTGAVATQMIKDGEVVA